MAQETTNIKVPSRVHAAAKAFSHANGYKLEWIVEMAIRQFLRSKNHVEECAPKRKRAA